MAKTNSKKLKKEKKQETASNQEPENEEQEKTEAAQNGEINAEEGFEFHEELTSQRKAPLLQQENIENLENMLEGAESKAKEENKEEVKYTFEKPKYSFSEENKDDFSELKRLVLKEMPSLIKKTSEAREVHNVRINEQISGNLGVEGYVATYVPAHKENILLESEEIKGKKVNIVKYSKER